MISREKTFDAPLKVHEVFRNRISTITETTKSELSYLGEKIISKAKESFLHFGKWVECEDLDEGC